MKTKKLYKFGDCISASKQLYKKLKNKGYNPYMVEGYAEVNQKNDILPDYMFLYKNYPDERDKLDNINYMDYPKVLPHTWIELNGKIIDKTVNQFNKYGGVIQYHILERYKL